VPEDDDVIALIGILPFLSTLLGGMAALRLRHRLHPAMAAAAGILVATALVDLFPEAIELIGHDRAALEAGAAAVVGFLIYTAVEALIHQQSYEHSHPPTADPDAPHRHEPASAGINPVLGWLAPAGLIAHSVLDGLAIGLGFEAGAEVGIIVTLAVLVHDFADGLNIVTVALAGGRGRGAAVALLAIDAVASIVGIAASQVVPLQPEQLGVLLGGFSGAFIAIGAGHLLPEAQHRRPEGATPLAALAAAGAVIVVVVRVAVG
jgi:zinc transporter ZupT